ncbi:unnamed protein product [Urochloa humidicola]
MLAQPSTPKAPHAPKAAGKTEDHLIDQLRLRPRPPEQDHGHRAAAHELPRRPHRRRQGGRVLPPGVDVLPEILRHSVPIKGTPPPAEPSLSASSRWTLPPGSAEGAGVHPDALNPLRSYVSLPQATYGPKSWEGISCCNYFGVWRRNSCAVLHSR